MSLFSYKGVRVRKFHERLRILTFALFSFPFLSVIGLITYTHLPLFQYDPIKYGAILFAELFGSLLVVLLLHEFCYRNFLFFARLENLRVISHFLLENNLYVVKRVKRNNKTVEHIKLPKVYLKRDKFSVVVTFQLQGSRFQERFLLLEKALEIMFDGDFMNKQFTKGYVSYTIATDQFSGRLSIFDVEMTEKGIRLMKDVYWDFDAQPHLLIGGGTGGGKTILLMTLIWVLSQIGHVDILDPKRSDFVGLKKIPVFKERVYWNKTDMLNCLKQEEKEMDKRYDYMTSQPNYEAGKKYYAYGLKPRFVIIDELAALSAKLERDFDSLSAFIEYLTELILKGRQAGVFLIVAMQRPDGEYLKTSLRDQFMKRISVGHLEDMGYKMMFGEANASKVFKKIDEINGEKIFGRGYIANGGEVAQEFYSPVVPLDQGFSFFDEYAKLPVLDDPLLDEQEEEKTTDVEDMEEISENTLTTLNNFAEKTSKPVSTLRNLVKYIEEQDYVFSRVDGQIVLDEADVDVLETLLSDKEQLGLTYKQVVLNYFVSANEPA